MKFRLTLAEEGKVRIEGEDPKKTSRTLLEDKPRFVLPPQESVQEATKVALPKIVGSTYAQIDKVRTNDQYKLPSDFFTKIEAQQNWEKNLGALITPREVLSKTIPYFNEKLERARKNNKDIDKWLDTAIPIFIGDESGDSYPAAGYFTMGSEPVKYQDKSYYAPPGALVLFKNSFGTLSPEEIISHEFSHLLDLTPEGKIEKEGTVKLSDKSSKTQYGFEKRPYQMSMREWLQKEKVRTDKITSPFPKVTSFLEGQKDLLSPYSSLAGNSSSTPTELYAYSNELMRDLSRLYGENLDPGRQEDPIKYVEQQLTRFLTDAENGRWDYRKDPRLKRMLHVSGGILRGLPRALPRTIRMVNDSFKELVATPKENSVLFT